MLVEKILFLISLPICCVILYVLGQLWFVDTRNRKLRSLFLVGIAVFFWVLFNAFTLLVTAQAYAFLYTLRMITVCVLPYCLLWFFLNYSASLAAQSTWVVAILRLLAAADVLLLVTNPIHWLYFTAYIYPRSPTGPLFWIHTAAAYTASLLAFFVLFRYIIRHAKKRPSLILAGLGTLLPYGLNILYTFQVTGFVHDLTPFGFFVAFVLFSWVFYRSRLLNVKTKAFENIFTALKDIILIVDTDNMIVDCSSALGEAFPDFEMEAGKTAVHGFLSYLAPRLISCSVEGLLDRLAQPQNTDQLVGELVLSTSGGVKTLALSRQVIHTGRKITGYVLNFSDISEYRAMITEIDQQNKRLLELKELAESASEAKGAFLANMSHEMRTPLNAIIGMTTIAQSTDSPAKKDECIAKVAEASAHLLGVINDVLDMSKIEANKLELVQTEFRFEHMLIHSANFIAYSIKRKGQMFKVRTAPNLPHTILGDEQRISQVITNLLSNAVKFTPDGGQITLRARLLEHDEDRCVINVEVEDTGIGIDEAHQAKLFASFQQADAGISRKYGGTGLGLAISKRIVEMAGGEMYLRSQPGRGSLFGFTLPVTKGNRPGQWDLLRAAPPRVLVVDKADEVRRYFQDLAKTYGFPCAMAADAEEACAILSRERGARFVAFLDWNLSGMGTAALADRLRECDRENRVVLMAEGTEESDRGWETTEVPTDHIIQKPLFGSEILDAIARCVLEEGNAGAGLDVMRDGMFQGRRVLLAEDVEINREIVITLLEPTGVAIDAAENGNEVLALFAANPEAYDAIFMDIHMPEKDGYAATRELRALDLPWAKEIPIIAMTANVFSEDVARCLACGMNDHVGKPIVLEEVVARLSRYLPVRQAVL